MSVRLKHERAAIFWRDRALRTIPPLRNFVAVGERSGNQSSFWNPLIPVKIVNNRFSVGNSLIHVSVIFADNDSRFQSGAMVYLTERWEH